MDDRLQQAKRVTNLMAVVHATMLVMVLCGLSTQGPQATFYLGVLFGLSFCLFGLMHLVYPGELAHLDQTNRFCLRPSTFGFNVIFGALALLWGGVAIAWSLSQLMMGTP